MRSTLSSLLGLSFESDLSADAEDRLTQILAETPSGCRSIDYGALSIEERMHFIALIATGAPEARIRRAAIRLQGLALWATLLPEFCPVSRWSELRVSRPAS